MGEVREFRSGWSIARLADEFRMDRKTVSKRIREAGIPPVSKRSGYDVYSLADVAGVLVDAAPPGGGDVVDPRDLAPMERRAYFQSENERLKVETTVGTLVPAAEVEADYAEMIKKIVQHLDTLPDVLERDCALTPEQVIRVQQSCDELRQSMYDSLLAEEPDGIRDSA